MNRDLKKLTACFCDGGIDLKALMETYSVRFENLSLHDLMFIESECKDLRQKFEDSEKVECFRTLNLQSVGFGDTAYFSINELDLVKNLSKDAIDQGLFNFKVEKIKVSRPVLEGHIRDRKEWEKI